MPTKETEIYSRTCKHFTGLLGALQHSQEGRCKAGVCYAEALVLDQETPPRKRFPCLCGEDLPCARRELPTAAETEKFEAEMKALLEDTAVSMQVRQAIVNDAQVVRHRGQTVTARKWAGMVTCPKCLARIYYSISQHNGHIAATCETPDCIQFME